MKSILWPKVRKLIIRVRSFFSLEQIVDVAKWVVAGATLLFLVIGIVHLSRSNLPKIAVLPKCNDSAIAEEQFLSGPLALRASERPQLARLLEQRIQLAATTTRPGLSPEKAAYSLCVAGDQNPLILQEGDQVHLSLTMHSSGGVDTLVFSKEPADLMASVHPIDPETLLLKVSGKTAEEMELIFHSGKDSTSRGSMNEMQILQGAKWWGSDRFFQEYGGTKYQSMGRKQKLQFFDGKFNYSLFAAPGDYLTFREGQWDVLASLEEADPKAPLAQLRSSSRGEMEIIAWGEDGFSMGSVRLSREKLRPRAFAAEKVFTAMKVRSHNQISCQVEKKRLVLKENDWLIKGKTGWHKLVTEREIDAFLSGAISGELIVIEGCGKTGLRGKYFDPMRVQMQAFALPIAAGANAKKSKRGMNR